MNEEKRNTILQDIIHSETFITALVAGILFPLIAWSIEFVHGKVAVSLSGIGTIHKHESCIVDYLTWFLSCSLQDHISLISGRKETTDNWPPSSVRRDARMNTMADFAQNIGEGNYTSKLALDTNNDMLAQSLLVMRDNLLQNSRKESELSWIAGGKETISDILQQYNKIDELANRVIHSLVSYTRLVQGALYIYDEDTKTLKSAATYAYNRRKYTTQEYKLGYGLIGECAYEMDYIYRTEIPDDYVTISFGLLGDQKPRSLLLIPLISDEKLQGVLEFASLETQIPQLTIRFLKELGEIIARTFFNLENQPAYRKVAGRVTADDAGTAGE